MKSPPMLEPVSIARAHARIKSYIHKTSILTSNFINEKLGHNIFFKCENFQKIGAFKIRGALNTLLKLREENQLPEKVVAFSSSNHAQGVALGAKLLGCKAMIFMPINSSKIKQQATMSYGAELKLIDGRDQTEIQARQYAKDTGAHLIASFDNDSVIEGQGTACYEALQDIDIELDAIFAPCGGGGLLSGTYLAKELLSPNTKVYGAEPILANKVQKSLEQGKVFKLNEPPNTICDGVKTLSLSERTFKYIKRLDGFYSVSEDQVLFWTQWLTHLLKINLEPSCAMPMQAIFDYCKASKVKQNILMIVTGGNVDQESKAKIWQYDYLEDFLQIPA